MKRVYLLLQEIDFAPLAAGADEEGGSVQLKLQVNQK
jgi:hypothetical protein